MERLVLLSVMAMAMLLPLGWWAHVIDWPLALVGAIIAISAAVVQMIRSSRQERPLTARQ